MKTSVLILLISSSLAAIAVEPTMPRFRTVDLDTKVEIGYGVTVADMDGDKKPDIVLADKNQFVWYKNPGWQKYVMTEKLTVLDHVCVAAKDIDGDGRAEVVAGAGWNPGDTENSGSAHYLVPMAERTGRWYPFGLPFEPTVHRMHWVKNAQGKYDLVILPLHGRGNKAGQGAGVKMLLYKKPANLKEPWITEVIDDSLHMTHNFDPVHWDEGVAEDLLVAGKEGVFLYRHGKEKWEKTQLAGNEGEEKDFTGAGEVRMGKLPGGKRFIATVEPMHGNQLVIYTAPTPGSTRKFWQRHVLDKDLIEGHALACGDLIGIKSDQIVVGWRGKKQGDKVGIKMFVPLDVDGLNWKQTLIDDNGMACEDLKLADFDSDGRLDIVASGRSTHNLKVYYNLGP